MLGLDLETWNVLWPSLLGVALSPRDGLGRHGCLKKVKTNA